MVFYDDPNTHSWSLGSSVVDATCRRFRRLLSKTHQTYGVGVKLSDTPFGRDLAPGQNVMLDESVRSKASVKWVCNQGHEFPRRISRYVVNEMRGCPYCKNKNYGATLSQTHPDLVRELHPDNDVDVSSLYSSSAIALKWVCGKCSYEWISDLGNRTSHGAGCPNCYKRSGATSQLEQDFRKEIARALKEDVSGHVTVTLDYSDQRHRAFLDMCTEDNIAIEYDSLYWHRNKVDRDRSRVDDLAEHGYQVISIREIGLPDIGTYNVSYDPACDTIKDVAETVVEQIRAIRSNQ